MVYGEEMRGREGYEMAGTVYEKLSGQIDMLSYSDRLRLLAKIVSTLSVPDESQQKSVTGDFEGAFGLWKDRDVSLESVRAKAWGRM